MSQADFARTDTPEPSPVWHWGSSEDDAVPQPSFASSSLSHPVFGELFRRETYKAAETVRSQGTPIREFGIVAEGCLKTSRYTIDGTELCNAGTSRRTTYSPSCSSSPARRCTPTTSWP